MKAFILAALMAVFSFPAFAQPRCFPVMQAIAALTGQYGEMVAFEEVRIDPESGVEVTWQVWANPENGSWTFSGRADGFLCVFKIGTHYAGQDVSHFLDGPTVPEGELL